jgi:methionine sulfoxide reductase heme-binding subunit
MNAGASTLFWIMSRAAGTTAMVLASASVGLGLTMRSRLIKRAAPDRRTLHEILALSTMVAIAVHGLALLGDTYFNFTPLDIAVPLLAPYRNAYTSVGIVAGWGMVILGLAYYARKWIGHARWRTIHRFTALAWLLALVHTFTVGTDAGDAWFIALMGLTAAPALIMLVVRHVSIGSPRVKPRLPALTG